MVDYLESLLGLRLNHRKLSSKCSAFSLTPVRPQRASRSQQPYQLCPHHHNAHYALPLLSTLSTVTRLWVPSHSVMTCSGTIPTLSTSLLFIMHINSKLINDCYVPTPPAFLTTSWLMMWFLHRTTKLNTRWILSGLDLFPSPKFLQMELSLSPGPMAFLKATTSIRSNLLNRYTSDFTPLPVSPSQHQTALLRSALGGESGTWRSVRRTCNTGTLIAQA